MSVFQLLGSFVQSTFFGGTYDDLAFEVRVLKGEVQRLHDRIDKEMLEVRDRLDKLEGKPGVGKGRSRLSVMSSAAAADAREPATPKGPQQAAPADAPPPAPVKPPAIQAADRAAGAALAQVSEDTRLIDAWRFHPGAPAIFAKHALPACPDCALSDVETLSEGVGNHGLDPARFVAELNRLTEN